MRGSSVAGRLLFVGDIHLGRRPTGLPENLRELAVEPADLSPAAAWRTTVAAACAMELDAVVLAGDVVDTKEDRFEAYHHLEAGVQKLKEAGIPVFAVVGNHDVEVLPRLARQIPELTLLGPGGSWTTQEVATRGGGRVRLLGWSFPHEVVRESPLLTLRGFTPAPDCATIGVLHCELGASGSGYAPVARSELEAVPVEAWLLGHVHKPATFEGARPTGYLGSLVGLDPGEGERGLHGPCLVEVDAARRVTVQRLALAPLRYELEEIELGAFDPLDPNVSLDEALTQQVLAAYDRIHARIGTAALAASKVVACRLRLIGRSRHHGALRRLLADFAGPPRRLGETLFLVEKIEDVGEPALDLAELARGSSPPALVARRLLALQRGEAAELVQEARRALATAAGAAAFTELAPPAFDERAVRDRLGRSLHHLLEELLEQRAAP